LGVGVVLVFLLSQAAAQEIARTYVPIQNENDNQEPGDGRDGYWPEGTGEEFVHPTETFKQFSAQHQINVWVREIEKLRDALSDLQRNHAKLLQRVNRIERGESAPIRPRSRKLLPPVPEPDGPGVQGEIHQD
jgi:hypothetical protein